jgi:voltage-gated potassium channel
VEPVFSFRRFGYALGALLLVLVGGAIGYHAALPESWLQSVYRSVVTVSLTGLDSTPKNDSSRILTMILVLAGITIFAYIGSLVVEAIARGVIGGTLAERRRRKAIEALRDHYIICGFGRVGRRVADEFQHEGAPFVVLDFSPEAKEAADEQGVLFIEGNGTDDDDLREAGLERPTTTRTTSTSRSRRGPPRRTCSWSRARRMRTQPRSCGWREPIESSSPIRRLGGRWQT